MPRRVGDTPGGVARDVRGARSGVQRQLIPAASANSSPPRTATTARAVWGLSSPPNKHRLLQTHAASPPRVHRVQFTVRRAAKWVQFFARQFKRNPALLTSTPVRMKRAKRMWAAMQELRTALVSVVPPPKPHLEPILADVVAGNKGIDSSKVGPCVLQVLEARVTKKGLVLLLASDGESIANMWATPAHGHTAMGAGRCFARITFRRHARDGKVILMVTQYVDVSDDYADPIACVGKPTPLEMTGPPTRPRQDATGTFAHHNATDNHDEDDVASIVDDGDGHGDDHDHDEDGDDDDDDESASNGDGEVACAACKYVCVHCSLLFVRVDRGASKRHKIYFFLGIIGTLRPRDLHSVSTRFHASLKSATGLDFLGRSAAAQEKRESLAIELNANSNRGFDAAPTIRRPELPLGCLRVLPFCCIRARLASALGS
jgi:hypothetical protein